MKKAASIFLILSFIILAGCEYDVPLFEKQGLPLDNSLIGTWENVVPKKFKINISRLSPFEYSIHLTSDDNEDGYLRGYPIKISNISCVQMVLTDENYNPISDSTKYVVISYEISGGNLITDVTQINLICDCAARCAERLCLFVSFSPDS